MSTLTVRQVAERLNVSEKTIRRLVTTGKLAETRVGRSVRISEQELERYCRDNTSRRGEIEAAYRRVLMKRSAPRCPNAEQAERDGVQTPCKGHMRPVYVWGTVKIPSFESDPEGASSGRYRVWVCSACGASRGD